MRNGCGAGAGVPGGRDGRGAHDAVTIRQRQPRASRPGHGPTRPARGEIAGVEGMVAEEDVARYDVAFLVDVVAVPIEERAGCEFQEDRPAVDLRNGVQDLHPGPGSACDPVPFPAARDRARSRRPPAGGIEAALDPVEQAVRHGVRGGGRRGERGEPLLPQGHVLGEGRVARGPQGRLSMLVAGDQADRVFGGPGRHRPSCPGHPMQARRSFRPRCTRSSAYRPAAPIEPIIVHKYSH